MGKPDASDSELYSVVFEKVGKDPARMQAIKEYVHIFSLILFKDALLFRLRESKDNLVFRGVEIFSVISHCAWIANLSFNLRNKRRSGAT